MRAARVLVKLRIYTGLYEPLMILPKCRMMLAHLFVGAVEALVELCGCASSPEPSRFAYAISTVITYSHDMTKLNKMSVCKV